MSLKTQLAKDMVNCILSTTELGESITYTPKGAAAKTISAQVFRARIQPAGEDSGRTLIDQVEIIIANDATSGVTSINKGGDKASLPDRVGGTSITWTVADILGQDPGAWHLLLTK